MHVYRMASQLKMRAQTWPPITLQSIIMAMPSTRVLLRRPITTDPPPITISEAFYAAVSIEFSTAQFHCSATEVF